MEWGRGGRRVGGGGRRGSPFRSHNRHSSHYKATQQAAFNPVTSRRFEVQSEPCIWGITGGRVCIGGTI